MTGTLGDPWTALILGGSGPTASGVTVGPETAMRCAAVFGAVKVLSETVAQLPCHLYRRLPDGGRERAGDHPLEPLLADTANPWTPASEFRLVLQTHLALFGNAYAFVNRDGRQVAELIPLDPHSITVAADSRTSEPIYTVSGNGGQRSYDRSEILHVRGVGAGLYQGDSPVSSALEAIGLAIVLEQHGAGLFGRGARPSGVLKHPRAVSADTSARLRASFGSMFRGGENAGRTAILEDGLDFVPLQLTSVDSQFLELRKFQLQEIARIWRVPLHMLADLERVTFSNAEAMGQQFLTFCLLPIPRLWQGAMRITLLTPEERRAGYYVEFLVDDLARADLAGRFTAYSQAINAGVLNPNEVRSMENRGPYAGGETYTRPVNTAPVPPEGTTDAN